MGVLVYILQPSTKECTFSDVVAEVTQPSLGVGYEVGRAVAMNKKILCIYRPQEGKSMF